MDWQSLLMSLSNIAVILQALLVIASIYFIWRQLRESTRLARATNTQALVSIASQFYLPVMQDPDVARIWQQGYIDWNKLNEIDKFRYRHMLLWWLIFHENIYYQWKNELIDEDTYKTWSCDFKEIFLQSNLKQLWEDILNNTVFQPSFVNYLHQLMQKHEAGK